MHKTCNCTHAHLSYINAAALCTAKTGILINLFPSIPHLPEKKTKHSGCLNCLYYVVESVIGRQKVLCSLGAGKNRSSVNDFMCLVVGSIFARLTMALYISNLVSFPLLQFFQSWSPPILQLYIVTPGELPQYVPGYLGLVYFSITVATIT